ncbi:MAG: ABC transporter ATP-binding protein [Chloroflexota bacterium]
MVEVDRTRAGAPLIAMRGIGKRFGDVQALAGADFELRRQEVRVLVGENGAGKTSLMNVLAGLYQPDEGEILVDGRPARIASPRDALDHGIGMVHQHFELVPAFSSLENVILGQEGGGWWLNPGRQRRAVAALMERFDIAVDLDTPVGELAIGEQQKVEILKALYRGARVLILDEPTTHLTPQEVDGLFRTIRQLAEGGLTIVLITHKLREIMGVGDSITVMRRGRIVGTIERAEASEERLVGLLMGGRADAAERVEGAPAPRPPGRPLLELAGAATLGAGRRPLLSDVELTLRAGELVGVAGVAGNGQRELAEVIVGTRRLDAGSLRLGGRDLTAAGVSERALAGLAYVPEDRMREGILPRLSVAETFALGVQPALAREGWLVDQERLTSLAAEAIEEYAISAPGPRAPTALLSGGNIQKVLVARAVWWIKRVEGGVLVAMNPTRGLDLGTTAFVQRRLLELRDEGDAVLLVSEDVEELMRLSDRIIVMYRGRIVGALERAQFDAYRIGALMAGGGDGS